MTSNPHRYLTRLIAASVVTAACGAHLQAAVVGYDFDAVTLLARGALLGVGTAGTPVPGFELAVTHQRTVVYRQSFGSSVPGQSYATDSATKTLSAGLLLQVASTVPGFSLDSTLGQWVPAMAVSDEAGVTLRQAFSHTAGFSNSNPVNASAISDAQITLQQAATRIASQSLAWPPGTRFSYGGVSMHAAGAAVEVAGGAPWNELFAQRIATPLGMTHTYYELSGPNNPRIAGGARSTASDFLRFMDMLVAGGTAADGTVVLTPDAVASQLTRQTPAQVPVLSSPLNSADYGVGIWLDRRDGAGELTGALAAGARGFSAWVDLVHGSAGVLATDSTSSGNVLPLHGAIRDAIAEALQNPRLAGDTDRNGVVDVLDLRTIWSSWQLGGRLWSHCDANGDGLVNELDLMLAEANYVSPADFGADWLSVRQSLVPEPMVLLPCIGLAAAVLLRRGGLTVGKPR